MALSDRVVERHLTVAAVREMTQSMKPVDSLRKEGQISKPISSRLDPRYTEPDFLDTPSTPKDSTQMDFEELENGVNILRLALARLTTLVDSLPQDSDVRGMLTEKRFEIHEMIDSLIKSKVKISRRPANVVLASAKS
jgi:hypothetical protein